MSTQPHTFLLGPVEQFVGLHGQYATRQSCDQRPFHFPEGSRRMYPPQHQLKLLDIYHTLARFECQQCFGRSHFRHVSAILVVLAMCLCSRQHHLSTSISKLTSYVLQGAKAAAGDQCSDHVRLDVRPDRHRRPHRSRDIPCATFTIPSTIAQPPTRCCSLS